MAPTNSMNALYNKKTLFSLSGASVAVWIFTTVIAGVFNINIDYYKWVGLIMALFLSFMGAFEIKPKNLQHYTIIFFNGLLIYLTACGIDSINHSTSSKTNKKNMIASIVPMTESKIWWKPNMLVELIDSLERELSMQKKENTRLTVLIKHYEDSCNNDSDLLSEKMESLKGEYNKILSENYKLNQRIQNLSNKEKLAKGKELNASKQTIDLNYKINEYNTSMLKQTSELSSSLYKKLSDFSSTGKYLPGVYSVSYLQKDIIEFQSYLESCVLEMNYLLENLNKP